MPQCKFCCGFLFRSQRYSDLHSFPHCVQVWHLVNVNLVYNFCKAHRVTPHSMCSTVAKAELDFVIMCIQICVKAMPKLYRVFYRWGVSGRCYSLQQLEAKRKIIKERKRQKRRVGASAPMFQNHKSRHNLWVRSPPTIQLPAYSIQCFSPHSLILSSCKAEIGWELV